MEVEAVFFSPKKAGVISPPPGRMRALHSESEEGFRVG